MNILIVDDDKLVTSSLKTIIESKNEISVLGIGNNGNEAIELYNEYKPDVLLMDIRMPELTGIEAATSIIEKYPNAKILFLTTFSDDEYIVKALKIGAKGYILKQDFSSIIPAIQAVYSGQTVFGNEVMDKLPQMFSKGNSEGYSKYNITEKEKEIIYYIAEGLSNKEISNTLFLSEGTTRNYISIILEKLNVRDRTQIAIFYYKNK